MENFSVRFFPPWNDKESECEFNTIGDFFCWFDLMGNHCYEVEYDYDRVSDLLSAAKAGDMIYLDQTLKPVQKDDEILIEIRCNKATTSLQNSCDVSG